MTNSSLFKSLKGFKFKKNSYNLYQSNGNDNGYDSDSNTDKTVSQEEHTFRVLLAKCTSSSSALEKGKSWDEFKKWYYSMSKARQMKIYKRFILKTDIPDPRPSFPSSLITRLSNLIFFEDTTEKQRLEVQAVGIKRLNRDSGYYSEDDDHTKSPSFESLMKRLLKETFESGKSAKQLIEAQVVEEVHYNDQFITPDNIEQNSFDQKEITEKLGRTGGSIESHMCLFEFPEGALKEDTEIKIKLFKPKPGKLLKCEDEDFFPLTEIVQCSPSNFSFGGWINISLYTNYWNNGQEEDVQILTSYDDTTWTVCGTASFGTDKSFEFQTKHFSPYVCGRKVKKWKSKSNKSEVAISNSLMVQLHDANPITVIWSLQIKGRRDEHNARMERAKYTENGCVIVFEDFILRRDNKLRLELKDRNKVLEFQPNEGFELPPHEVNSLFDGFEVLRNFQVGWKGSVGSPGNLEPSCRYMVSLDNENPDNRWNFFPYAPIKNAFKREYDKAPPGTNDPGPSTSLNHGGKAESEHKNTTVNEINSSGDNNRVAQAGRDVDQGDIIHVHQYNGDLTTNNYIEIQNGVKMDGNSSMATGLSVARNNMKQTREKTPINSQKEEAGNDLNDVKDQDEEEDITTEF